MNIDLINQYLISYIPVLTAVASIVTIACKIFSQFKALKKDVTAITSVDDIKTLIREQNAKLDRINAENEILKKQLNDAVKNLNNEYVEKE